MKVEIQGLQVKIYLVTTIQRFSNREEGNWTDISSNINHVTSPVCSRGFLAQRSAPKHYKSENKKRMSLQYFLLRTLWAPEKEAGKKISYEVQTSVVEHKSLKCFCWMEFCIYRCSKQAATSFLMQSGPLPYVLSTDPSPICPPDYTYLVWVDWIAAFLGKHLRQRDVCSKNHHSDDKGIRENCR